MLPLQHLVEHLRWGCTDQAQQAWLMQAVFDEHAHQLAERIREHFRAELSRTTANLGVAPAQRWFQGGDKAADLIDPAVTSP